jgi:hypothetical protein
MRARDLEEKHLQAKGPLRSNVLGWHYKLKIDTLYLEGIY